MPRPLPDEDACDGAGVDVPSEPDLEAWERRLALARLGDMALERLSLMKKLHLRTQELKQLRVMEEKDCCCCAICHARCLSLQLASQEVDGLGAVMAVPRATSSHGDNLKALPKESLDFWGR